MTYIFSDSGSQDLGAARKGEKKIHNDLDNFFFFSQKQDNFILIHCIYLFIYFFVISVESTSQITSSSLQNKVFTINKYIDFYILYVENKYIVHLINRTNHMYTSAACIFNNVPHTLIVTSSQKSPVICWLQPQLKKRFCPVT